MGKLKPGKVHKLALGLSLGILWGLGLFIVGLIAMGSETYGHLFVQVMASIYPGYAATFVGSLLGALWGFIDLFIAGLIVGFLYNLFACCKCPKQEEAE